MYKLLIILNNILYSIAGLTDNCNNNEGLIYCKSSNNCIIPIETPCSDFYSDCNDCLEKQRNGLNIACPNTCNTIQVTELNVEDNCDTIIPECSNNYLCPKILICDSISNYNTYKLYLLSNTNLNIINVYALFGDSEK